LPPVVARLILDGVRGTTVLAETVLGGNIVPTATCPEARRTFGLLDRVPVCAGAILLWVFGRWSFKAAVSLLLLLLFLGMILIILSE
jgi:hypothetical protein